MFKWIITLILMLLRVLEYYETRSNRELDQPNGLFQQLGALEPTNQTSIKNFSNVPGIIVFLERQAGTRFICMFIIWLYSLALCVVLNAIEICINMFRGFY